MSASPAQAPSGPNSVTPTTGGPPAQMMRKKPPVNIFNNSKKKPLKRPPGQRPAAPGQAPNGARPTPLQQQPPVRPPTPSLNGNVSAAPPAADENEYTDYPIVISKRALNAAGQRFHALKFHSRKNEKGEIIEINPFDESQFVKPLRLHRRYARDKMEVAEQSDAAGGVDDKEREVMNARRAERQAEREENQKLIAPTGGDTNRPMKKKQQKKVEEGRDESNPARQKRQKLRYEEARPWHLEDFEGKNVWVGSYEEALSERSIMLQPDVNVFRMVPVEKWYRFIETNKVRTMDPEEAEKIMQKKFGVGRWGLNTQKANDEHRREEAVARIKAARQAKREEDDDRRAFGGDDGDFQADRDMLDMEFKDEFQDDDEGMLFQGDEGEDEKEIEQKIWLEMRNAGLGGTGVKDEDLDPEEEERRKAEEEREEKDKTKQLRKQLMKKEHQIQYGSDDEEFDSDDSDEEDQRKKEEQEKEEAAKKAGQVNGDKSGSSTRGTNTPSGRPEKRPGSTLGKRPGSPDVSDLSGNESSRKKIKSANGAATAPGRALSPDMAKKKIRSGGGSGSGSDTDTSRGRPKIKLKNSPPGSPSSNTPNGSRSGTPAGGSRAQSAKPNGGAKAFPTLEEVRAAIPPDGIEIKTLVGMFKTQVAGRSGEFIALVKAAGIQNKTNGRIMQKT
ncbi:hypothetical protein M409DRAFT_23891 [Zasmidium cellare ATCC 36951]|uniref:Uncharacterized protein n=1 Tax=Zasmidium cellare ATCC 36951 TaxID=1080233 RepID=A0A6A6CHC4_ZASCE|nr:uncharacterized protein M409DRAFT_23891 [Zasmidium cellare ATCC 36951]KAF2165598.1 hypothetical protein M409DRAFT_23891 [Zasmidium cellare ATCC 36951]